MKRVVRFAWLPIPLFLAAFLVLRLVNPQTVVEAPSLLSIIQFLFVTLTSLLVAILIGRSFLVDGSPTLLMIGCGVAFSGAAGFSVPFLFPYGSNALIGGHNSLIWLSALSHLIGVAFLWRRPSLRLSQMPAVALLMAYAGVVFVAWLIVLLARADRLPLFFMQCLGGTPLRYWVLSSAIVMFGGAAFVIWRSHCLAVSAFYRWYAMALLLLATSLLGVMIAAAHGGALSWTARAAQGLAGGYMVVAAIATARETGAWRIALSNALQESEDRYRSLVKHSPEAILVLQNERFVYANPAAQQLLGAADADEFIGRPVLERIHPEDRDRARTALNHEGGHGKTMIQEEWRVVRPDGQVLHVECSGVRVLYEGRTAVQMVWRDVTEQKLSEHRQKRKAEELEAANLALRDSRWAALNLAQDAEAARKRLEASLAEKEILVKEVHHRVKNNLQVIVSLVNMQMDRATDPALRHLMADMRDRVRSMALVHEQLYQATDLGAIDFADYARRLLNHLWKTYGAAARVRLNFDLQPVTVSIHVAVPCGLILNELAGNALKHAFPDTPDGAAVHVALKATEAGRIRLRVQDNGIGLPDGGANWRETASLGLKLVCMLTEQLNGTVEATSAPGDGAAFEVEFEDDKTLNR